MKRGRQRLSDRQEYNIVTDTITGPNVRYRDNLFQGIFTLVTALIGTIPGYIFINDGSDLDMPIYFGPFIGGFLGMIVGVFLSGIILMIYRAAQHFQGRHD